jgi:hypothetical protein
VQRADREHPIPEVSDVVTVKPKDVEALRGIRDEPTHPLVSSVDPRHRRSQGLEDHVGVDQLVEECGIEAAAFEGLGRASKGFAFARDTA